MVESEEMGLLKLEPAICEACFRQPFVVSVNSI